MLAAGWLPRPWTHGRCADRSLLSGLKGWQGVRLPCRPAASKPHYKEAAMHKMFLLITILRDFNRIPRKGC